MGIGFFCPHNHTEHFEVKATASENFYHELDMVFLQKVADAVLAIPGWNTSTGTRAEIEFAKQKGLPIFYPKSPNDLSEIITWSKKS